MDKMDLLAMLAGGSGMPGSKVAPTDTAEAVYISPLALLKMLRHASAGVPLEVMGILLGDFPDEYTVRVFDVFSMPQSASGVSVEAIDEKFQSRMQSLLAQVGRSEAVVGWYHSHPGLGCWLSSTDLETQRMFEKQNERAVAVVLDPVQSVKGHVVVNAFRSIHTHLLLSGKEPRQSTSNLGLLRQPSVSALSHGLNKSYYSLIIHYKKTSLEEKMLVNFEEKPWMQGLKLKQFDVHEASNVRLLTEIKTNIDKFNKNLESGDEKEKNETEIKSADVGEKDVVRELERNVEVLSEENLMQGLQMMLSKLVFK